MASRQPCGVCDGQNGAWSGSIGDGAGDDRAGQNDRGAATGTGGGAAAGTRIEPRRDGEGDRPLSGMDLPLAQPVPGRGNCRRRAAPTSRRATAAEPEYRAGNASPGAIPRSRSKRRHPGGSSDQGRAGGRAGAHHGPLIGLQSSAPARLAQTGAGQAPSPERSCGAGGVEKNSPRRLPSSLPAGRRRPRSS